MQAQRRLLLVTVMEVINTDANTEYDSAVLARTRRVCKTFCMYLDMLMKRLFLLNWMANCPTCYMAVKLICTTASSSSSSIYLD